MGQKYKKRARAVLRKIKNKTAIIHDPAVGVVRYKLSESRRGEKNHNWKGGEKTKKKRKCFTERTRRVRKIGNGGLHTLKDWEELKKKHHYMCLCCKKHEPWVKLTEDHIIPLVKGGNDNIENIQPLCVSCNSKKHTKIIRYGKS